MAKQISINNIARRQFLSLSPANSQSDNDKVIDEHEQEVHAQAKTATQFLENTSEHEGEQKGKSKLSLKSVAPAAALLVAACGDEESEDSEDGATGTAFNIAEATPLNDAEASRFLTNAQFSASDAEIENVQEVGYLTWLNGEMDKPITQTAIEHLQEIGYEADSNNGRVNESEPFHNFVWGELFAADDAVRKRVALALSEFFVVGEGVRLQFLGTAFGYYWDILNRNAFGDFRTLLEDVTLSPVMGRWLNMHNNRKADPATGRMPDENFARELMQLFSIGLVELNLDGTARVDSDGNEIQSYSMDDVVNLASVLTGWAYDGVNRTGFGNPTPDYARTPMTSDFRQQLLFRTSVSRRVDQHSLLEANVLGTNIPANTDAPTSLSMVLDTIFNHPNVGPFFGRQMIQRLVTSNPSPEYVARVASAFNDNGDGVRGDLRAVFTAILIDEEAVVTPSSPNPLNGRLREPLVRFIQWGRTFGLNMPSGLWTFGFGPGASTRIGQQAFRASSVFNFFRPGFVPAGTAIADNDLVAPEFQLANEVRNIGYLNFMNSIIGSININNLNIDAEIEIADDAEALVDRINLLMTANQLSSETRERIITAVNSVPVTATPPRSTLVNRLRIATFLTMASSDYLIKK